MSEQGWVVEVRLDDVGTELVADAAAGASSLVVDYAGEFEDAGTLDLNGVRLAYTGIVRGVEDGDTDTITLAAPLAAAAAEGDRVSIVAGGQVATELVASVSLGDGEPVDITIPFEQRPLWPLGYYPDPVPVEVSDDLTALEMVPQRAVDTVTLLDEAGQARTIIGRQEDGTYTHRDVNAPPPPTPAGPSLSTAPGVLIVSSYGVTADGSEWPLDFARIEVHVGNTSGFPISAGSKVAEWGRNGGSVTIALPEGTWFAVLVAVNTSGAASAPSPELSAAVPPPYTSDGEPPAESPTPTVTGGIGSVFVRWAPVDNADPVTYEVHGSTMQGFTPGASTLLASVDGTLLAVREVAGAALEYDTVYYFRVVARDMDGAAAPGGEASGGPAQVTTNDIAANAITADMLVANNAVVQALEGEVVTGTTVRTSATGPRAVLGDPDSLYSAITFYTGLPDESNPSRIAASSDFRTLVISGGAFGSERGDVSVSGRVILLQSGQLGGPVLWMSPDGVKIGNAKFVTPGTPEADYNPDHGLAFLSDRVELRGTLRSPASDGSGPLIELRGAGSGRVGPLSWDAAGNAPDTGDLAASNGFTGSVRAIRHGKVVNIVGSMTNPNIKDYVWTSTGIVLPESFRPAALIEFPVSSTWTTFSAWGYRIQPNGAVECRRGATSNASMPLASPYFV